MPNVSSRGPTVVDALLRASALQPLAPAFRDGERTTTYAALLDEVRRAARLLEERGAVRGERVALAAENGLQYLVWTFAAAWCGAVLVPLNWRLAAPEIAGLFDLVEPRLAVVQGEFAALVEAANQRARQRVACVPDQARAAAPSDQRAAVHEDDTAHLYCTSGTTGEPKGVELTHRNVHQHALCAAVELGLGDRDVWGHVAPMFHLADAWATVAITLVGGVHVALPRFEARAALDLFERERVTVSNLVPTMLALMVAEPDARTRDLSAFRLVLSGGASIAPSTVRAVEETFRCEYVQTYGMTETSPYLTLSRLGPTERALPEEERFRLRARTGRPFMGVELEVRGPDGRPVPRDDRSVGEIVVRAATVMRGYWRRPDLTAAVMQDGWLATGDLARIDARGFVEIVDRKKDMIVTGGENVYTTEVEHALAAHPDVLEVAVFGVPHALWGETVCAAVVPRVGRALDTSALAAHCRERLAGYKCPREFRVLAALPRTGTGKIAKRLLRDPQAAVE
jgi:acyl-CoA synthetase (AMP-forming)/AMP-acid ligase II